MSNKQYAKRNHMQLDEAGGYYMRHVFAMIREALHSKSDIAGELAWRDMEIDRLKSELAAPAQEVRQPMTNRQKNEMLKKLFYRLEGVDGDDWDWMVIDAVEAHHGITYKQGEVMTQDEMIEECIIACEALKIEYAEIAASPLVTAQGADIYRAMSAGANNCMVALRELQAQYLTGDHDAS